MAVICDNCGTRESVRRAFMTLWNGNVIDLCKACMIPIAEILDKMTQKSDHYRI